MITCQYPAPMELFNTNPNDTVFANRDTLQGDYIPDELAGNTRDNEMKQLAEVLQPIINGDSPDHVILRGPNGSGKTATVRIVLNVLEHRMKQVEKEFSPLIINGAQHTTGYQLTRDLANKLHSKEYKQGHSYSTLIDVVADGISNLEGTVVVAIDELSGIEDISRLLFLLTRSSSNDALTGKQLGVLATTTDTSFRDDLSSDVKSTLGQRTITFSSYTSEELRAILDHRVEQAFTDETVDDAALSLCAALASRRGGDARFALDLLKYAGDIASQSGNGRVSDTEIDTARTRWEAERVETFVTDSSLKQRQVIYALAEIIAIGGHEPVRTVEIATRYKEIAKRSKSAEIVSDRMVARYLRSFVEDGLLRSQLQNHSEGTWREYQFAFDLEHVLTTLKIDFQRDLIDQHSELNL